MTVQEARDTLGYRHGDTIVKSGLEAFRKAYKNVLKTTDLPLNMKRIYERDLNAVETLLSGTDGAVETIEPAPAPKRAIPKPAPKKKTTESEEPSGFVSLFV